MLKYKNLYNILRIALTVLALACVAMLVMMCIFGVDHTLTSKKSQNHFNNAKLEETYNYGEGYIKKIVFLGDRTIYPLNNTLHPNSYVIWSGENETLTLDYNISKTPIIDSNNNRHSSIAEAVKSYAPEYMVITVGLDNGVGYCTKENFKNYYSELIDSIKENSPDTRIILQSVFPVSRAIEKTTPTLSIKKIVQANQWVAELCNEKNLRYLDTFTVLADKKGHLDPQYDSGDGITLNKAGYEKVLNYIKTHGYN